MGVTAKRHGRSIALLGGVLLVLALAGAAFAARRVLYVPYPMLRDIGLVHRAPAPKRTSVDLVLAPGASVPAPAESGAVPIGSVPTPAGSFDGSARDLPTVVPHTGPSTSAPG
jgi:hypothetical protein